MSAKVMTEEFFKRIDDKIPLNENKIKVITTLLGVSAALTEFILLSNAGDRYEKVPMEIKYAMALGGNHIMAIFNDEYPEFMDMSEHIAFNLNEQTQEHLLRKYKLLITKMYESFEEMEKI